MTRLVQARFTRHATVQGPSNGSTDLTPAWLVCDTMRAVETHGCERTSILYGCPSIVN